MKFRCNMPRGDPYELQGEVIIYSNTPNLLVSTIGTTDIEKFAKRVSMNTIPKNLEGMFFTRVGFKDERELFSFDPSLDIVNMGNWKDYKTADLSLIRGANLYIRAYLDQQKERQNDANQKFGDLIQTKYIGRIIDASRRGEVSLLDMLKDELRGKARDTPYAEYVENMLSHVNPGSPLNLELINAYTGMIKSIEGQDFESAANFRDKIRNHIRSFDA